MAGLAEDPESRTLGSAALFGVPVLLGAIWGIAQALHATQLGGRESSGLIGPSLLASLLLSPLLTLGFVRRSYGTLAAAAESAGLPKLLGSIAALAAIALIPTALTVSGLVTWFNGLGIDSREEEVECTVISTWHRIRKGTDLGWHMSYSCPIDGETLLGSIDHLSSRPEVGKGDAVRFRAARGRFGIWVRRSEPLPATTGP